MNMKRHFFWMLPAMAGLLLTSCINKTQYTIDGHAPDEKLEGQTAYLINIHNYEAIDSAIVENGRFTMQGECETSTFANIRCFTSDSDFYWSRLVVEPGTIYIDIVNDSLSGTELNNRFYSFINNEEEKKDQAAIRSIITQLEYATDLQNAAPLMAAYDSLSKEIAKRSLARTEQLYNENQDNALGAFALHNMAQLKEMDYKMFDSILTASSTIVNKYRPNLELLQALRAYDQTSAGHPYIDITGKLIAKDTKGNHTIGDSTNLSTLIEGKIAVVDFRASWCGPCVKEIKENLIPLSKKYAKKGVVVVGVDLNDSEEGVINAVQRFNIHYPILVADENPATTYGFNGIPQIMLIDQEGIIVARDLRGEQIEEAIKEALAKQK